MSEKNYQFLLQQINSPLEAFCFWEKETPEAIFLRQPFGKQWEDMTWKETGDKARRLASYFKNIGLNKGDHIAIISKNCREWLITDIAIAMAEMVSVPIFPNQTKEKVSEIIELGVVKCLVLGKLEIWDGLNASHLSIPILQMPHYSDNLKLNEGDSWDKAMSCPPLENFAMPSFSDTWAIIFTSGTTGKPKGVEISYLNLHSFVKNQLIYNDLGAFDQFNTSYISYLPLNHIAEKVLIACIAIYSQSTIHFAENLTSFSQNLKDARPHIFFSVPRIYIKIKTSLESRLGKSLTFINSLPIIKHWFRKFLLKKIGLDRAFCVSGSAVLAKDIKQWYNDTLGLRIADIYGQSESLGVISMTPRGALDFGSVGKPIAGMQVKLSKDTQELLYKADWTMSGYYKEVAITQEVFDDDGFIRSGDQARISEDGKIYIIGRVKESFKTEKGKYIVPNILEQYFQSLEVFEHLCVLGFGLPQPILLLVVNPYAKEIEKSKLHDMLDLALTKANESLSNEEKISHIVVLDELWDAQNDMLTPTLKIKRNKVNERYLEQCQKWQQESSKIIFVHF